MGQAVLGLDYVIVINILPAGSIIQLPLVVSATRNVWFWLKEKRRSVDFQNQIEQAYKRVQWLLFIIYFKGGHLSCTE